MCLECSVFRVTHVRDQTSCALNTTDATELQKTGTESIWYQFVGHSPIMITIPVFPQYFQALGWKTLGLGLEVCWVIKTFILGGLFWPVSVAPSSFPLSLPLQLPLKILPEVIMESSLGPVSGRWGQRGKQKLAWSLAWCSLHSSGRVIA